MVSESRSWRKVLYEKQHYKDNYVDESKFLSDLNLSTSERKIPFMKLLFDSVLVAQQITVVTIYFTIFKVLLSNKLSTVHLYIIETTVAALGMIIIRCIEYRHYASTMMSLTELLRMLFIFGVCVRTSAPILQTLTQSFSDDTVYAMVLVLITAHIVFYDYPFSTKSITLSTSSSSLLPAEMMSSTTSIPSTYMNTNNNNSDTIVSTTTTSTTTNYSSMNSTNPSILHYNNTSKSILSLNAALFSSIILASRFHDLSTVVAFCILSVLFFVLLPKLILLVRMISIPLHLCMTLFLYLTASLILLKYDSFILFATYQVIMSFLIIVCSLWLSYMQAYKKSIHGSWEEAKVS